MIKLLSKTKLVKPGPALLFPVIAAAVILLDQVTKSWIIDHMAPGQSFPERSFVFITYVRNSGAAFGLAVNPSLIIVLAITVAVASAIFFYPERGKRVIYLGLGKAVLTPVPCSGNKNQYAQ
ncbi:signal peptidase II [Chloroflexota bacterium]